ncbi:hypothetical protein AB0N38_14125 [Micromonospora aurantiaca]|uniref:hypothetical protein n=1 Tax=Micromonospora aurantiaca (nom. illeg.) TaxID=47850 RepID=UPI00343837EE
MTKPPAKRGRGTKPTLRPTTALAALNGTTSGNLGNHYLSTCKLCPLGVFDRQPKVWLTKPMGWSHQECAEYAGLLPEQAQAS